MRLIIYIKIRGEIDNIFKMGVEVLRILRYEVLRILWYEVLRIHRYEVLRIHRSEVKWPMAMAMANHYEYLLRRKLTPHPR